MISIPYWIVFIILLILPIVVELVIVSRSHRLFQLRDEQYSDKVPESYYSVDIQMIKSIMENKEDFSYELLKLVAINDNFLNQLNNLCDNLDYQAEILTVPDSVISYINFKYINSNGEGKEGASNA